MLICRLGAPDFVGRRMTQGTRAVGKIGPLLASRQKYHHAMCRRSLSLPLVLLLCSVLSEPAGTRALQAAAQTPAAKTTLGPDQELDGLLTLAAKYFTDYEKALSSVVSEEDYLQRYSRPLSIVANLGEGMPPGMDYAMRERRLKSDFLLVRTNTASGWIPFRDVFEVDGKKVRDREKRLAKLFLDAPATAVNQATVIMKESARYNLGDLARTINIPMLPLLVIDGRNRGRFAWKTGGDQTVEGVRTRRVDFEEMARPTLVRSTKGEDVPIFGALWIDPMSGRLVKGRVRSGREATVMEMTVIFRPNDALGVWVPAEMQELYRARGETIEATARYANFRRFQVKTEEAIRIQKLDDDDDVGRGHDEWDNRARPGRPA